MHLVAAVGEVVDEAGHAQLVVMAEPAQAGVGQGVMGLAQGGVGTALAVGQEVLLVTEAHVATGDQLAAHFQRDGVVGAQRHHVARRAHKAVAAVVAGHRAGGRVGVLEVGVFGVEERHRRTQVQALGRLAFDFQFRAFDLALGAVGQCGGEHAVVHRQQVHLDVGVVVVEEVGVDGQAAIEPLRLQPQLVGVQLFRVDRGQLCQAGRQPGVETT